MTEPALRAAPDAGRPAPAWTIELTIPVAAALFLTLTDAFGLGVLSLPARLAYWLVLLGLGQAMSLALRARLGDLPQQGGRRWTLAALVCVAGAVPMSLVVWAVTALALRQPLHLVRLLDFYLAVLVVAAAMAALNLLVRARPQAVAAAPAAVTPAGVEPIRARLPDRLKTAALYALQAEDHYVRVHTAAGSDLVLLRFADAVRETGMLEGAQVHRSWWVARAAVTEAARREGKRVLLLPGGLAVPVSRRYAKALQESGWPA